MAQVTVDSGLIKEALAEIEAKKILMDKVASLETELYLVEELLQLAQRGHVEVNDVMDKVAQYRDDIDEFRIFKKAVELNAHVGSLGQVAHRSDYPLSKEASVDDAEERFLESLKNSLNK